MLRHGESIWNKENRFCGWIDVGLTDKGTTEAQEAGRVLGDNLAIITNAGGPGVIGSRG